MTGSVRVNDVIKVPSDFTPDLISSVLLMFNFVRLFDILRKTFDMTDLDAGRTLTPKSTLGVRGGMSLTTITLRRSSPNRAAIR